MTPPRPSAAWVPDRGEVIWIDHNPQAGREMRDQHPFLVLSTARFQRLPDQASSTSASTAATSPSLR